MKKQKLILPIALIILFPFFVNNKSEIKTNAASNTPNYVTSLTKNINLNRNTQTEIRNYYSSLNSLNENERKGENLLKNLKPILQDMDYFSYDNVWKIYEITDREWELSPANETTFGQYNIDSNTINNYQYGSNSDPKNNPYVKTLYRNREESGLTVNDARIREWGSHAEDGTNREHIWCQSRGFKASSGAKGPAGTDLHHLRSGDGYVNQTLHNDNPYGFVDKNNISKDGADKSYFLSGNLLGKSQNENSDILVFEPQDSDKGDIARAIFYMAACYNNLDGSNLISEYNPNLKIVDTLYKQQTITSTNDTPATMAKLSDLLAWHQLDPVDEFEIYRNDLIYNNYQHNRNPFIDFPSWVDVIWGNDTSLVADPSTNQIHGGLINLSQTQISINILKINSFTLSAKTPDNTPINWIISDTTIINSNQTTTQSDETISFEVLKIGETTITASSIIDGKEETAKCKVIVTDKEINSSNENEFKIELWMIILGVAIVIIFIIIIVCSSSARKKVKKQAKKVIKKQIKNNKKKNKH